MIQRFYIASENYIESFKGVSYRDFFFLEPVTLPKVLILLFFVCLCFIFILTREELRKGFTL